MKMNTCSHIAFTGLFLVSMGCGLDESTPQNGEYNNGKAEQSTGATALLGEDTEICHQLGEFPLGLDDGTELGVTLNDAFDALLNNRSLPSADLRPEHYESIVAAVDQLNSIYQSLQPTIGSTGVPAERCAYVTLARGMDDAGVALFKATFPEYTDPTTLYPELYGKWEAALEALASNTAFSPDVSSWETEDGRFSIGDIARFSALWDGMGLGDSYTDRKLWSHLNEGRSGLQCANLGDFPLASPDGQVGLGLTLREVMDAIASQDPRSANGELQRTGSALVVVNDLLENVDQASNEHAGYSVMKELLTAYRDLVDHDYLDRCALYRMARKLNDGGVALLEQAYIEDVNIDPNYWLGTINELQSDPDIVPAGWRPNDEYFSMGDLDFYFAVINYSGYEWSDLQAKRLLEQITR